MTEQISAELQAAGLSAQDFVLEAIAYSSKNSGMLLLRSIKEQSYFSQIWFQHFASWVRCCCDKLSGMRQFRLTFQHYDVAISEVKCTNSWQQCYVSVH